MRVTGEISLSCCRKTDRFCGVGRQPARRGEWVANSAEVKARVRGTGGDWGRGEGSAEGKGWNRRTGEMGPEATRPFGALLLRWAV